VNKESMSPMDGAIREQAEVEIGREDRKAFGLVRSIDCHLGVNKDALVDMLREELDRDRDERIDRREKRIAEDILHNAYVTVD